MTASAAHRPLIPVLLVAALLGAALLAALLLLGVLARSNDEASTAPPEVGPLRVASGAEVATGFAVGRERVVTVAHVLDGAVRVGAGRARVVRVDRRSDLALLAVPGVAADAPGVAADAPEAEAAGAPRVEAAGAGDQLRIVRLRAGHASVLSVRARRAILAHVRALGSERAVTRPALELAGRVAAGDSGAPVVSRSGALVGVVFAASSRNDRTAYAVDARALRRLLARG